jgi:diguanylate cyclase (GGDEF)-like protein
MSGGQHPTNPPLARRFTWRDTMRPETLISEDRGLRARAYGTLFLVGGALALLILVVGEDIERRDLMIATVACMAVAMGLLCFFGYRRLPDWYFVLMTFSGTAFVTVAVHASSHGAEGVWVLFYFWVTSLASLFFSFRFALLQVALAVGGFVAVSLWSDIPFAINYVVALAAVLGTTTGIIALLRIRIERLAGRLAREAQTDALTQMPNRRVFEERFTMEADRSERSGEPLSVAVCDLDRFKEVNDSLGHESGDDVLRRAATAIGGAIRSVDLAARLGGEEFGVILPGAESQEARAAAERIRLAVEDEFEGDEIELTISCGVATRGRDGTGRALIRAADLALYRAKQQGRNRTVVFEPQIEADSSTK